MTTQELILHTLGKIDGKIDAMAEDLVRHATESLKLDQRVGKLEQAKWKLAGAMAASVIVAQLLWRITP